MKSTGTSRPQPGDTGSMRPTRDDHARSVSGAVTPLMGEELGAGRWWPAENLRTPRRRDSVDTVAQLSRERNARRLKGQGARRLHPLAHLRAVSGPAPARPTIDIPFPGGPMSVSYRPGEELLHTPVLPIPVFTLEKLCFRIHRRDCPQSGMVIGLPAPCVWVATRPSYKRRRAPMGLGSDGGCGVLPGRFRVESDPAWIPPRSWLSAGRGGSGCTMLQIGRTTSTVSRLNPNRNSICCRKEETSAMSP